MTPDMTKHTIRGVKEHRNQQETNVTPTYNLYTTALSIAGFLAFSRSCRMSLQKTHTISLIFRYRKKSKLYPLIATGPTSQAELARDDKRLQAAAKRFRPVLRKCASDRRVLLGAGSNGEPWLSVADSSRAKSHSHWKLYVPARLDHATATRVPQQAPAAPCAILRFTCQDT